MEILNTYLVHDKTVNTITLLICFVAIICLGITIANLVDGEWIKSLISFLITIIFSVLFCFGVQWWASTETIRYETMITDYNKVDLNKCKIVETKCKIVVLEEVS